MNFTINNTYIKYLVIVVVIMAAAIILSKIIRKIMGKFIKIASGKLNVDQTKYNFLKNAVSFIIYLSAFILIFYLIPELKTLGLSLFAGAGILAAVALFASQQAFANIISGIFIVIFKPFRVNDYIKVGDHPIGRVEDITLMHTIIRNFENRRIIIPNSAISSETVINSSITEEKICNFVEIGISYDADINKAMDIMQTEAMKHPDFIDNRTPEEKKDNISPVKIRVTGFGDSSVNLRAYVWSKDHGSGFVMKSDLRKSIKEEFDRQGIEIPFPYRTIVYKKDI